jgi:2-polyprenyl-6-methoxyphenol hydroxylase-like FAD-dependent oxidoreductase
LANEFGAAVGLYPNGTGILRAWGIFAETFGANSMSRFVEYARDGSVLREFPEPNWTCWKHPSQLVYRVALHEGLKQIATSPDGPGTPAKLFTSSKVVAVNPEQGTVTLENGTVATADVVVGADGVYVGANQCLD